MRSPAWRSSACLALVAVLLISQPVAAKRKDGAGGGPGGGGSDGGSDGGGTGPVLSFSSDKDSYQAGERVQLSWASEGARFCTASGDWDGKLATSMRN